MNSSKKIVISAHGDTNWNEHRCKIEKNQRRIVVEGSETISEEEEYYGHMDNFAGVYTVMKSYFSGRLSQKNVRIEITYGEEKDMEGAKEVVKTLSSHDVVIVVDVTGTKTDKSVIIEKCRNKRLRRFIKEALGSSGILHDLYPDCPDPIENQDETNVYGKKTDYSFFFGIPTRGGDYNEGPVRCWKRDLEECSEALVVLINSLQDFETDFSSKKEKENHEEVDYSFSLMEDQQTNV